MSEFENWATQINAGKLARRIERFWAERGERVSTWLEPCGFGPGYVVRSDMLNGLPRQG